ncbi:hypothetical protein C8A00DRAFT_33317 [Chaetomidium leptoderma]|uniref:Aminoglycoside phosphotransferase domain-containing protein n=1 Tax=Chaetomidium leptoderma TaxID=669021 RepID=A0AAN6VPB6_9PEZI|nr:hypothetical protein C8A00DRAFT_33317 [Chaetomidium leptoderma]
MTRPIVFRYSQFNLDALLGLASGLRKQACTCDESKPPLAGSLNWVIFVSFGDSVEWVFRSPHSGRRAFLSEGYTSRTLASEVATLKYVKKYSSIPVPDIFAYSASRDNDIGVPYILMSKAPGHPLSRYDWLQPPDQPPPKCNLGKPARPLSDESKQKVMSQLGAIASQLSRLRFDKIGSLFQDGAGNYTVGECLSPALTWQGRDSLGRVDRGPYDDERAYLEALIAAYVSHAQELPLTPHAFFAPIPDPAEYANWASYRAAAARWNDFVAVGQKIDNSKNRLAFCIAARLMRDMMMPDQAIQDSTNGFPLGQPDLHLGNIFVDEDLNITCIIDWGSASSVPLAELLAASGQVLHICGPETTAETHLLTAAFRAGFERTTCSGNPRVVGSDTWARADMVRPFQRLVRMLSTRDYHDFAELYALACPRRLTGDDEPSRDIPSLFSERARRSENRQLLHELGADDLSRDDVERHERAAFGRPSPASTEKMAVARKLTLVSEMNERFVADRRLWQWIEHFMERP